MNGYLWTDDDGKVRAVIIAATIFHARMYSADYVVRHPELREHDEIVQHRMPRLTFQAAEHRPNVMYAPPSKS